MILRLFRATLRPGAAPEFFRRLREYGVPRRPEFEGRVAFVYGFRHVRERTVFLGLSVWRDVDAMDVALGGHEAGRLANPPGEPLLDDVTVDHFELVDEPVPGMVAIDGPVIGVVTGQIRPNEDPIVHDMIRSVMDEVSAAGVTAMHVGRRVVDARTDLVVLAVWRDRASLHRFAQQRGGPAIDPEFAGRLTDLRFSTYDCLSPERLALPHEGAAILLADDDRRCIDASPGFESVLGVPGELVLRRALDDLAAPSARHQLPGTWARFMEVGTMAGTFELWRPDGHTLPVTFRAAANVLGSGIHALVFDVPGRDRDERTVSDIAGGLFSARPVA